MIMQKIQYYFIQLAWYILVNKVMLLSGGIFVLCLLANQLWLLKSYFNFHLYKSIRESKVQDSIQPNTTSESISRERNNVK